MSGLARVLRGNAVVALENVALWHERDISHSSAERIILPDSCTLLDYMLVKLRELVEGLQVYPERMQHNLELSKGLYFSQSVLLALTTAGAERKDAYEAVQRAAMRTWKGEGSFAENAKQRTGDHGASFRIGDRCALLARGSLTPRGLDFPGGRPGVNSKANSAARADASSLTPTISNSMPAGAPRLRIERDADPAAFRLEDQLSHLETLGQLDSSYLVDSGQLHGHGCGRSRGELDAGGFIHEFHVIDVEAALSAN